MVVSVVSHVGSLFLSGGELAVQWPHLLFGGAARGRKPWDARGLSHEFINVYYIMFIWLLWVYNVYNVYNFIN